MARSAKVTSVEAVGKMANVMKRFHEDALNGLENLNLEIQRALNWVQSQQKDYWTLQVRRGWEQMGEAKAALHRARVSKGVAGREPACVDEKRAVARAQRRLQLAEEKLQAVRKWSRIVDRAVVEYQGCTGQMSGWLATDCFRAVAALERMAKSLDSYLAVKPIATSTTSQQPKAKRAASAGLSEDILDKQIEEEAEQEEQTEPTTETEENHPNQAPPTTEEQR